MLDKQFIIDNLVVGDIVILDIKTTKTSWAKKAASEETPFKVIEKLYREDGDFVIDIMPEYRGSASDMYSKRVPIDRVLRIVNDNSLHQIKSESQRL